MQIGPIESVDLQVIRKRAMAMSRAVSTLSFAINEPLLIFNIVFSRSTGFHMGNAHTVKRPPFFENVRNSKISTNFANVFDNFNNFVKFSKNAVKCARFCMLIARICWYSQIED